MTKQVRGLLVLVAGLAVVGLASCGHYTCSATLVRPLARLRAAGWEVAAPRAAPPHLFTSRMTIMETSTQLSSIPQPTSTRLRASPSQRSPRRSMAAWWLSKSNGCICRSLATRSRVLDQYDHGALTALPLSPYPTSSVFSISSDPLGHFLFVAAEGGGVSVYQISQTDGSLTLVPGSPFATQLRLVDHDGWSRQISLCVARSSGDEVAAFSINSSTGALTLYREAHSRAWVSICLRSKGRLAANSYWGLPDSWSQRRGNR